MDKQVWQRRGWGGRHPIFEYPPWQFSNSCLATVNKISALLPLLAKWVKGQRKLRKLESRLLLCSRLCFVLCVVAPERWVIPDLLIGLAADLEHLFALELQLFSQSADVLVEGVDLVVQLGDVILPPGDLLLQLGDPAQQLALLGVKVSSHQWRSSSKEARSRCLVPHLLYQIFVCSPSGTSFEYKALLDFQNKVRVDT